MQLPLWPVVYDTLTQHKWRHNTKYAIQSSYKIPLFGTFFLLFFKTNTHSQLTQEPSQSILYVTQWRRISRSESDCVFGSCTHSATQESPHTPLLGATCKCQKAMQPTRPAHWPLKKKLQLNSYFHKGICRRVALAAHLPLKSVSCGAGPRLCSPWLGRQQRQSWGSHIRGNNHLERVKRETDLPRARKKYWAHFEAINWTARQSALLSTKNERQLLFRGPCSLFLCNFRTFHSRYVLCLCWNVVTRHHNGSCKANLELTKHTVDPVPLLCLFWEGIIALLVPHLWML